MSRMTTYSLTRLVLLTAASIFVVALSWLISLDVASDSDVSIVQKIAVLSSAAASLLTAALVAGVGSVFGALANLFKLVLLRKPGVSAFDSRLLFNPFNVIFFPRYLTDEGLIVRSELLRYSLIFVLAMGIGYGVIFWMLPVSRWT